MADKFYTNGFSTVSTPFLNEAIMAMGSLYIAPKAGTNILATVTNSVGSTNLPIVLNDVNGNGVGTADIGVTASYNPQKNSFTVSSNTNSVTLSLTETNGVLSGSFVPVHGAKPIPFNGVLLPSAGAVYGFFAGTNQDTGSFTIAPPAPPPPPPIVIRVGGGQ